MKSDRLLTDDEIIDAIDLDSQRTYYCADGSMRITLDVETLLKKQDAKTHKADCKAFREAFREGLIYGSTAI